MSAHEHICAVCKRQTDRAIGVGHARRMAWVCSRRCEMAVYKAHRHLIEDDLTYFENRAREHGGAKAGQYLDTLGKHDLRTLTPDEWRAFVHTAFDTYHQTMVEQFERLNAAATQYQGNGA